MARKPYALLLIAVLALAAQPGQCRPLLVVFEVEALKDTPPDLVREATSALKSYFRDSGKVEAIVFNPELPLVRRAVMEKVLNAEELVNVSSPEQRLKIARAIEATYAAAGSVQYEKDLVVVSVWFAETKTKKVWNSKAGASAAGPGLRETPMSLSNALQSATSQAVSEIVAEALGGVPVERDKAGGRRKTTLGEESPMLDAPRRVEQGDGFLKAGDTARAIQEYRRAVNMEPRNVAIRIKLSKAYVARGLLDHAIDELKRAQRLDPDNTEIPGLLVAAYEAKGLPDLAAGVYLQRARQDPNDVRSRLEAADVYRRQGKFDEAIQQLRTAAEMNPSDPEPRERLALLFLSRGMYEESRSRMAELLELVRNETGQAAADRYARLQVVLDTQIKQILGRFEAAAKQFEEGKLTHEAYYNKAKELTQSADSLVKLMEAISPPASLSKSHRRRILACSLISQYGTIVLSYVETKNEAKKREMQSLLDSAKAEIKAFPPVNGQDGRASQAR